MAETPILTLSVNKENTDVSTNFTQHKYYNLLGAFLALRIKNPDFCGQIVYVYSCPLTAEEDHLFRRLIIDCGIHFPFLFTKILSVYPLNDLIEFAQ